mgnify:CR=1 FL=1
MIWDRRYECLEREEIEQLQLERLQSTLNRVYRNVSFYKKFNRFAALNPSRRDAQIFYTIHTEGHK